VLHAKPAQTKIVSAIAIMLKNRLSAVHNEGAECRYAADGRSTLVVMAA